MEEWRKVHLKEVGKNDSTVKTDIFRAICLILGKLFLFHFILTRKNKKIILNLRDQILRLLKIKRFLFTRKSLSWPKQ